MSNGIKRDNKGGFCAQENRANALARLGIGIVGWLWLRLQFTVAACFAISEYSWRFVAQLTPNSPIAFFTSSFEGLM